MDTSSRATRAHTRMAGRAALEDGSAVLVDCIVEDLSPTGARVVFSADVSIPGYFDLVIGPARRSHRVRTVWRQANMAGVMFLKARANVPGVLPG
ncbi:hypothetical protein OCOJLMKI_4210 [Methylobacterium iners]|uniref:PilZ domain-containing protein n=1 Tax=Methylobacterium iners TaxID=418707 RepID=A0ABQ4S3L2_9HYPH|nr:hypothetical protein OCOJLMKI_4210 [Methylobacterium iners]